MCVSLFSYPRKMMQPRKMKKLLFCLCLIFVSASAFATDIPTKKAVLRGLDKVTGRISTFTIDVGDVGTFGKTFIIPEACYTRPPEETPENAAFLYVYEPSVKGENIELFKGWMFASNPSLSSMEHPVYDVWVLRCEEPVEQVATPRQTNVAPDASVDDKATPPIEPAESEQFHQTLPPDQTSNPELAQEQNE